MLSERNVKVQDVNHHKEAESFLCVFVFTVLLLSSRGFYSPSYLHSFYIPVFILSYSFEALWALILEWKVLYK